MLYSNIFGLGFLAAVGCASLVACTSDSKGGGESDASTEASESGGSTSSGGAGTGGAPATGGAAAGGAGTGGESAGGTTGDSGTGGAASDSGPDGTAGDASTGGTTSDSGTGGTTSDSGTGGTTSTGGADGGSSVLTCGSSPYARLWVGGFDLLDHPTGEITVSSESCPGTTFGLTPKTPGSAPGQTGTDAQFFDVPNLQPIHLRATQTGSMPLLTQEVLPDASSLVAQVFGYAATAGLNMVASDAGFTALDPSWNPASRALVLLQVAPLQGATGSCADGTGITVTVDGHSEAVGQNGATPIVSTSGNNGTLIFVTTTGTSTAAELLTLTVSKSGCTVKTTGYDASPGLPTSSTGKFPVEAGAVTWGLVAITN